MTCTVQRILEGAEQLWSRVHVLERRVNGPEVLEEGGEQPVCECEVRDPHHLSDRVHRQLRHAEVNCPDPCVLRYAVMKTVWRRDY
jgi:hypothetical protein